MEPSSTSDGGVDKGCRRNPDDAGESVNDEAVKGMNKGGRDGAREEVGDVAQCIGDGGRLRSQEVSESGSGSTADRKD